jgi:hypothetical protein
MSEPSDGVRAFRILALRTSPTAAKRALRAAASMRGLELTIDDRFPGYLLVDLPDGPLDLLDGLVGISALGAPVQIAPLPEVRTLPRWATIGASVEIKGGPFAGSMGTLLEADAERWSAKVAIDLFGRATPIALTIDEIRGR